MFTIGILLFGLVSLSRLNVNLLPEISYPTLTVRADYPGAAPGEIENLISKPVEEALGVVKNVRQVRSISRIGRSDVVMEFAWGTDMNHAVLDVREKLDALALPLEASRPVILRFDPSLDPIMRYAVFHKPDTAPGLASDSLRADYVSQQIHNETSSGYINRLKSLRVFADEQLKKELESAAGVASVKVSGGFEEEIQILVDQQRLSHLNLPIEQITRVLRAENVNLSGGRLEEGSQQYLVRTLNQFQTVSQIGDVIVGQAGDRPVYLKDVAGIRESYKEREAITRLNGMEAVEIAIYKEGDANTVAAAQSVKARMANIERILPSDMELTNVYDQSRYIESAVNEVVNAAVIGGILAVIILYLFLRNFWTTVIISISIPVSVIATFNMMYGYDISLNIMSLGGIALGVGLLVDNSIVVLENISRHRAMGKSVPDSAREGAGEVGMAVVASTLTTIAVFFPLVFVEGIAGQLFRDQALTVTFALLASLVVAITLIPMMASLGDRQKTAGDSEPAREPKTRFGRWTRSVRVFIFFNIPVFTIRCIRKGIRGLAAAFLFIMKPVFWLFDRGYGAIDKVYPKVIGSALHRKSLVAAIAFLLFGGTLMLLPQIGMELIPSLSQGEFRVEFNLPQGTPLDRTDNALMRVQQASTGVAGINSVFSVAGTGNRMDANPDQGGENWGEFNVKLAAGSVRSDEETVMKELRRDLQRIPDLQYKFSRPALFTFKTPVEIEVSGYELNDLKTGSDRIAEKLAASGRFADVKTTMEHGSPEVRILFDREKASSLGLQVHEVADRVVSSIRGDIASRFFWQDRRIDMLVRVSDADRASIDQIRRMIINPGSDRPVTLDAIAEIQTGIGPGEIRRSGQQRVALVTANLNYGDLGSAAEEISHILEATPMPYATYSRIAGQNEEMASSFRSLIFALLLAVFLVYLVMASQFESLMHPFVILFTIPLAAIGAIWALFITGSTISVVVFIGLILLAGIVVNNAIVLIDLINQLRQKGMEKTAAIIEGGRLRLRPIVMTTLTTTLGLLPLAIGFGDGAELRAPMAITVIGGLIISTLLTLIVIPVMYALLDRKKYQPEN